MNYLSVNEKYQSFNSPLAKGEKNDCVVRSIASAADISHSVERIREGLII